MPTQALAVLFLSFLLISSAQALTADDSRHLLARTGFNVSQSEINELLPLSKTQAIIQILSKQSNNSSRELPEWANEPLTDRKRLKNASKEEKSAFKKDIRKKGLVLHTWWYQAMLSTHSALTERMTLFWHNHFTSSLRKVKSPQLMLRQNQLLRKHALGSFSRLLSDISIDPAMLIYLDNRSNKETAPNENFARELLELFTLGEGHYSENDIKSVARAFTGHTLDRKTASYKFRSRHHDNGTKNFLGKKGNLDAEDILVILLQNPQTSRHITAKLWKEFITTQLPQTRLEQLAETFKESAYQIDRLLQDILSTPEFWHQSNRGTRIKSPAELIVGTLRILDTPIDSGRRLFRAGREMRQTLFIPPNVKGWVGGSAWIDSDLLPKRQEVLSKLIATSLQSSQLASLVGSGPDKPKRLQQLLLAIPPVNKVPTENLTEFVTALILDPAYQLN